MASGPGGAISAAAMTPLQFKYSNMCTSLPSPADKNYCKQRGFPHTAGGAAIAFDTETSAYPKGSAVEHHPTDRIRRRPQVVFGDVRDDRRLTGCIRGEARRATQVSGC